jgi:iron complex transport system substrate-binding protein
MKKCLPYQTALLPATAAVAVVLSLGAAGCRRSASASQNATFNPTSSAPERLRERLRLPDYVLHPIVAETERTPPPLRIVSTAPSITEICCALGLRGRLVGRTRYCTYPPGIEDVPSIGALVDLNVERLLELEPDLILISGHSRAQTERLKPLGLRVESVPDESLDDLYAAIRRIGELTGRSQSASRLCAQIPDDLDAVSRACRGGPAQRVLVLIGVLRDPPTPPFVAGPGSFYDVLLHKAGQRNAAPQEQSAFAPLSLEYLRRSDPDVIVELDPDGESRPQGDADALRVWSKVGPLRAVEHKRVRVLTGPEYYLLGPRIAHVYADLCEAIHVAAP